MESSVHTNFDFIVCYDIIFIIISQSQLLSVSLVFDNCQLIYDVISTYNQLVFDKFESAFNNMKFRLCCPFLTMYTTTD